MTIPDKKGIRILIIEPELLIAESLAVLLREQGYAVNIAHTSAEAIDLALNSRPNLLIVEPHLQSISKGLETVNDIISIHPTADVIFLTAWSFDLNTSSLKKPCQILSKPCVEQEIIQAVSKCVEKLQSKISVTNRTSI